MKMKLHARVSPYHQLMLRLLSDSLIIDVQHALHFLSDVDECLEAALYNTELCAQNTTCLNTEGDYECPCIPGFNLINGTCQSEP